jgi:hypothetical protein
MVAMSPPFLLAIADCSCSAITRGASIIPAHVYLSKSAYVYLQYFQIPRPFMYLRPISNLRPILDLRQILTLLRSISDLRPISTSLIPLPTITWFSTYWDTPLVYTVWSVSSNVISVLYELLLCPIAGLVIVPTPFNSAVQHRRGNFCTYCTHVEVQKRKKERVRFDVISDTADTPQT